LATKEVHAGFWWGKLRERDHSENLGLDGRMILKWVFKKYDGGMGWIDLAQYGDKCRRHVNEEINLQVPQNTGKYFD